MRHALLLAEFMSTPWALQPDRLAAFSSMLLRWESGAVASEDVMAGIAADRANLAARRNEAARQQEAARMGRDANIAVLPMYGILTQRGNQVDQVSGPGSTSTQAFTNAMRTREWTAVEPGVLDRKYYVKGIGTVKEITVKGGKEELELYAIRNG